MKKSPLLVVLILAALLMGGEGCGDASTAPKSQSPEVAAQQRCPVLLSGTDDYWIAEIWTIPFSVDPQATVEVAKCCFSHTAFQDAYEALVAECSQ